MTLVKELTTEIARDSSDPSPWTRRFGVLLTIVTFLLIGTGGLVTSYNAGLAVPDWPGSFGNWVFLPAKIWSDLAVMLEHDHRLTGQVAGLICITTLILTGRSRGWKSPVAILAMVVLLAYIYQGVMGGLRVVEKSVALAVIHGIQGQILFMLVVILAGLLGRWPQRIHAALADYHGTKPPVTKGVYLLACTFVLLLVMQLTLGAIIRHTHSASAIPDAPAVYGGFLPPTDQAEIDKKFYEFGGGDWQVYVKEPALKMEDAHDAQTPDVLDHTPRVPAKPPSVGLVHNQYMHRVMAMLVLPIVGLVLVMRVSRAYPSVPGLRFPVTLGIVLFVVQVLLGMSVIWSKESPHVASAHQALGAGLLGLATLITLRLHLARRYTPREVKGEATVPADKKHLEPKPA